MSQLKKSIKKSSVASKYKPLTVGSVEKETGYKSNIKAKNLRISEYFKKEGFGPLGEALEKIEHGLAK